MPTLVQLDSPVTLSLAVGMTFSCNRLTLTKIVFAYAWGRLVLKQAEHGNSFRVNYKQQHWQELSSASKRGRRGAGSQSSEAQRAILDSFITHKPAAATKADSLELLRSVRVLCFDFLHSESQHEDFVLQSCRYLVEEKSNGPATSLWHELLKLAAEHRQTGGDLTRDKLVEQLCLNHKLASLPDYSVHLDRWNRLSNQRLRHAKWHVSNSLPALPRDEIWSLIASTRAQFTPLVLVGNSGAGKSSLVKEHTSRSARRLYLIDGAFLSEQGILRAGELAGTNLGIVQLLKHERRPSTLLIDAAEQLVKSHSEIAFAIVKEVIHLAACGHLEIIVTCQDSAVQNVRAALAREKISAEFLPIPNPTVSEIRGYLADKPGIEQLSSNERFAPASSPT